MVDLIDQGIGGIILNEKEIQTPYEKNYDNTPDGGPLKWPTHFDIKNWGLFIAFEASYPVAAAAIAYNTTRRLSFLPTDGM